MTDHSYLSNLREPNSDNPLRVLFSACLTGIKCGYDSSANGSYPSVLNILHYPTLKVVTFCPEEYSFGVPRMMCDIHGGTGMDVLEGRAKVLAENGDDWSEGMIRASEKMLEVAKAEQVELAIMMDISAACGSQVIYDGNRFSENKIYQIGMGVCAAQLSRNGIKVISQRDYAALEIVYKKLNPEHKINSSAIDHDQTEWYKEYFRKSLS